MRPVTDMDVVGPRPRRSRRHLDHNNLLLGPEMYIDRFKGPCPPRQNWHPTGFRTGASRMQENLLAARALPRTSIPSYPLAGGEGAGCPTPSRPFGNRLRPFGPRPRPGPPNMMGWFRPCSSCIGLDVAELLIKS